MALVKTKLKTEIMALMAKMRKKEQISGSDDEYATELSDIIDSYIKSATIIVSGVITAGSPTTQTQTVPVIATIT